MGTRKKLWYTIVSYVPSYIRYERLNVGVIMGNEFTNEIEFKFITSSTKKLRYTLWDSVEKKEYTTSVDYLEFLLKNLSKNNSLFEVPRFKNSSWSTFLNGEIPSAVIFSDVHYAISSSPDSIFNNLVETYIGKQFFPKKAASYAFKIDVSRMFERYDLLEKKLKTNVKIQPAKNLPIRFEMDYLYLRSKGAYPSFIQITPKIESLNDWYKNTFTLLSKNTNNYDIDIIVNENDYDKENSALAPLLNDISSDKRVSPIFINDTFETSGFKNLIDNVKNSQDIKEWKNQRLFA